MSKTETDTEFRELIYNKMEELGLDTDHYQPGGYSKKSFLKALMIIGVRVTSDPEFLKGEEGRFLEKSLLDVLGKEYKPLSEGRRQPEKKNESL